MYIILDNTNEHKSFISFCETNNIRILEHSNINGNESYKIIVDEYSQMLALANHYFSES